MKNIAIFDNQGETLDRYTIVNTKTGDVIGCNAAPFHPQGIGQNCGNLVDNIMFVKWGAAWRRHTDEKIQRKIERAEIKNYLNEAKQKKDWLGVEITINEVNEDVKRFIKHSFEE